MTGRIHILWVLFALQLFCAIFFVIDAALDLAGLDPLVSEVDAFEYAVALALFLGVLVTGRELRRMFKRDERLTLQMRAAAGEFSKLIEEHFEAWALTAAERDVAILSLKGLSVAEIAAARGTAEGTVKAHSAAVYRKADVSGRHQLLSLFVDELIEAPVGSKDS